MPNSEYHPYPILREGLLTSMTQQASGTFLIATNDNASCRFAIAQGRLTHCSFSRLHGEEALIAFTRIQAGRYSFNAIQYPFPPAAKIAHEQAVTMLGITLPKAKNPHQSRLPSGSLFTEAEIEELFGKFYFE